MTTDTRTDEQKHALVKKAVAQVGVGDLVRLTGFKTSNIESYLSAGSAVLAGWRQDELVRAAEWAMSPTKEGFKPCERVYLPGGGWKPAEAKAK